MLLFDYEKNTLFLFVCQVNTNELHRRFVCHFDVDGCSCAATIFQKWRQSNRAKCDESEKEKEKPKKKQQIAKEKKHRCEHLNKWLLSAERKKLSFFSAFVLSGISMRK